MNKDNIESPRIEGLIPQQLLKDANALVEFLKEYYKFANQSGEASHVINNILNNRDLDLMVDSFIDLVYKEVGYGIAKRTEANKKNLYKHISEFYKSKGSLDSFKLLFRILFNTDIEIRLPKEQILVASDGRWSQQNSLFVNVTIGDGFDLYAKSLTISLGTRNVVLEVDRIKRIRQTNNYEISVTQKGQYSNIPAGTEMFVDGIEFTFINSLNSATLISAGQNFEIGQIFDINDGSNSGTSVKVASVDSNGSITRLDFLQFEPGYSADFTARLVPQSDLSLGDPDVIVTTDPTGDQTSYPNQAIFTFKNSTLAQYAGRYIDNKGFLSDDIYLQDNFFYQQYSYVIKSGEQFSTYSNIVKKTVHPSGMLMFGEFEINNRFDLARSITSLLRYYRERFYDSVQTEDDEARYELQKPVNENLTAGQQFDWEFYKPVNETVNAGQFYAAEFRKPTSDIINISENSIISSGKNVLETINSIDSGAVALNPYAISYFAEDYTEGITTFT